MLIPIIGALAVVVVVVVARAQPPNAFSGPSTVRVSADDFVVGDFPMVCVRTGARADGLVDIESDENRLQPWWLFLLFLGPIGIVAIVVLAVLAPRAQRVGGSLPMTHDALAAQNRLISVGVWAWTVPLVAFFGGAALLMAPSMLGRSVAPAGTALLALGLLGGFVLLGVMARLSGRRVVRVRLDGTGRWVELRNVHPSFAAAVNHQTRERHRAERERRERREH
jgi:hypothetical protein